LFSGAATYLSFSYFRSSERWITHTQAVRAAVGDVGASIDQAARERLSFLISGSPADLDEYRRAAGRIPVEVKTLRELAEDNPIEVKNCADLESAIAARVQAWELSIAARQHGQLTDLQQLMEQNLQLSEQSAAAMDVIRVEEEHLLKLRTTTAEHRFVVAGITLAATFGLGLLLLYLHYLLLTGELAAREKAEEAARTAYEREASVRQEQERFRVFVDTVKDYAIYVLDAEGRVATWNQGAERLKGYSAAEIIGRHFSCFFTEEDQRAGKPQQEMQIATEEGRFEAEAWRVRKDGSQFWANVVLTAIKDENGKLAGFAKVTRDFTERMRVQQRLRQANTELANEIVERQSAEQKLAISERALRELSLHLLRSQDEERRRIGRELHDSLGQYLAVLKMHVESLESVVGAENQDIAARIAECIHLTDESIREMRTISYLLYPPMLEEVGLKSAVPWYLEGFSIRSQIETTLAIDPDLGRLPHDVELALFRVLQESLTNVHRHSGSAVADIRLFSRNGNVLLEVEDQGRGISPDLIEKSGGEWLGSLGVGLRGMNERMRQLGGALEVSSTGKGTLVTAIVPINLESRQEAAANA